MGAPERPLVLKDLSAASLERLERALVEGRPCHLRLRRAPPRHLRPDTLIPLFDEVEARSGTLQDSLRRLLPPGPDPNGARHRVTAIIPTNRGTPVGLQALRAQDCEVEVLVLANGGAEPEGDRVLELPWEGHGPTRQRGVEAATGDYILFTVDDALPRGAGCVRALIDALEEGGYDAVFGRQLPWPSADPLTRRRLSDWTPAGTQAHLMARHDHVFALYRRETLLRHPLPEVPIGEDLRWRQGRRIGYVPRAMVVHSHPREPGALYRRTRDLHLQHLAAGDPPALPSTAALLRALPGALGPTLRCGPQELPNQLAELLGQWRAAWLHKRR